MTSVRAKRNSKVPNRFSSDNARIETSSGAVGETILDYNDNTTSTTNTLAPMNRKIKLKPAIREPLKVKLPKLKLSHTVTPQKPATPTNNSPQDKVRQNKPEVGKNPTKIHKIKLPSLSSRKAVSEEAKKQKSPKQSKSGFNKKTSKQSIDLISNHDSQPSASTSINETSNEIKMPSKSEASLNQTTSLSLLDKSKSPKANNPKLDDSFTSKPKSSTSKVDPSFSSATTSTSSDDDESTATKMEIVVATHGSEIRCPCGVDDDLGIMVECENCSTWQHGHCINVGIEDDAYEGYTCAFCTLPQGRHKESLHQLTVGDRFQSRFKLLDSLRAQQSIDSDKNDNETIENNAQLSVNELTQAIKDLHRVKRSLKVKWRLLTSQSYELELRIWQNPFWCENPQENSEKDNTIYFMDRCKSNIKLNIRNMVKKMDERCQQIDYALKTVQSSSYYKASSNEDPELESKVKKLQNSLDEVAQCVKEFRSKLKCL